MSRAFDAAAAPPKAGPYSHGVQTGSLVFLAGQGPFDPAGGPMPESFEEQARLTFSNLATVAEAAGGSLADAVRVGVYLRTMDDFAAMNAIYAEYFTKPYPARTTIQSNLNISIEVDAVLELGA